MTFTIRLFYSTSFPAPRPKWRDSKGSIQTSKSPPFQREKYFSVSFSNIFNIRYSSIFCQTSHKMNFEI